MKLFREIIIFSFFYFFVIFIFYFIFSFFFFFLKFHSLLSNDDNFNYINSEIILYELYISNK